MSDGLLVAGLLAETLTPHQRWTLLVALSLLMAIVVVGGVTLMFFRRRLTASEGEESTMDGGFSLSELRKMRDRGEMTSEEYERTRARVVAKVKASLGAPAEKEAGPTGESEAL